MRPSDAASALSAALLLSLCAVGGTQQASSVAPSPAAEDICSRLPMAFPFREDITGHFYNATDETLSLDLYDLVYKFCDDAIYGGSAKIVIKLDLVSTTRRVLKNKRCPSEGDARTRLQRTLFLQPENPVATFDQVQGRYFLRFSVCPFGRQCHRVACSRIITLAPEVPKDEAVCGADPGKVSAMRVRDEAPQVTLDFRSCGLRVETTVPLCSRVTSHSKAAAFAVEVRPEERHCPLSEFLSSGGREKMNSTVDVENCENCSSLSPLTGVLRHALSGLSRNSSYCVYYQMLNPHCTAPGTGGGGGELKCFFAARESLSCGPMQFSPFSLLTEPVFVGVVSATLLISLLLLMWTIVQCSKKRPGTPILGHHQPIKKQPPRSLTEDDLEHISRLPSQEIVLVYFPDTRRFKELNRKFRDWLVTLDVNDVKDIYDEKCSEEVLKDPEGWVRDTLGGPEKRIILVCSRLAYECLATVKRGISSPKFVETDPHFGLLTRAIQGCTESTSSVAVSPCWIIFS